jgi:phosphatidylglycerol:prolipoprotein diacylglycerol transferase
LIPHFDCRLLSVAGVPVHLFTFLLAIGVILGDRIVMVQGLRRGIPRRDLKFMNARILIWGFIGAHLIAVTLYFPERLKVDPAVLINIWDGMSSAGGILGATVAGLYYTRKERIPRLEYADAVALGLSVGWIFGRAGCFTLHDHPGGHIQAFFAVRYPDGPRHDLALYELLVALPIAIALFRFARSPRQPGQVMGLLASMYAPFRFVLDFLRATDIQVADRRYLALTPAQWACFVAAGLGIHLLRPPGYSSIQAPNVEPS